MKPNLDDDDELAPVMPAIDAVKLIEEEEQNKSNRERSLKVNSRRDNSYTKTSESQGQRTKQSSSQINHQATVSNDTSKVDAIEGPSTNIAPSVEVASKERISKQSSSLEVTEDEESLPVIRHNPLNNFPIPNHHKQDEYELIPKSVILDVYSNDPEVKRFLKQLPKIANEFGYNEQDYKCYSCRRPIGMVFGESRLCHFDGHHYCMECHLGDKSIIPARILCNWDFSKYSISKRNQHFLTLISNEPIFKLKTMAPLLYRTCLELREIEELRCQAFFIRSYCFTCVQDSISFELTKLVWPREHLIKQTDIYSMEDLVQIKSGALKLVLKNVLKFGRQHVLSCMLCCQKGFICELCKSSQIIYPFDTESVYRCNECQCIYHKSCYKSQPSPDSCPRCQRMEARKNDKQ